MPNYHFSVKVLSKLVCAAKLGSLRRVLPCNILLVMALALVSCAEDPEVKYAELVSKAGVYADNKQWEEARITYLSAIKEKPQVAETYFKLAEVQEKLSMLREAVNSYRAVVDLDPRHFEARMRLAAIFVASGGVDPAEEHVKKLLEMKPDSIDAMVLKASIVRARGRLAEARELLETILKKDPGNHTATANLGSVALDEGKFDEAERLFDEALAKDPKNASIKLAQIDVYMRRGEGDRAEKALAALVESEPTNPSLRMLFGEFLFARGLADRAEQQYEKTLELDSARNIARDRLYDMYLAKNEREKARNLSLDLQKKDPKGVITNYFRARDLELEGRLDEALKNYITVIQQAATFAPATRRAGLIELAKGEENVGIEHLNQAVANDPYDITARLALGRHAFRRKDYSSASTHATKILTRYPNQVGASVLLADVALIEGRSDRAKLIYDLLVQAFPNNPIGYVKLGVLAEKEKKYDVAVTSYRKALEFDSNIAAPAKRLASIMIVLEGKDKPVQGVDAAIKELQVWKDKSRRNIAEYNLIIGLLYANKGEKFAAEAKALLEKAVEEKPSLTEAYLALAQIAGRGGNVDAAIGEWQKFLVQNPKNISIRMAMGVLYESLGRKEEASNMYRDILKISPRFGPAANNLAWIVSESENGNLREALELAQAAASQLPDEPNVIDTLAWLHYKTGSAKTALPMLENAVEGDRKRNDNNTANPEILYHLGVVRAAAGDKDGAREALEEAKQGAVKRRALLDKIDLELAKLQ